MRRAMEVLGRYAETLRRVEVDHVEAVATSAVRDAANGRAFSRRVRRRLKLPLRIISGREEARLISLGVLTAHRFRRPTAVVTIGGGSAQVAHGDGARLRYVTSVPLGCARLSQQFIRHDPPTREEIQALEQHARRVWAPVIRALRRHRWHRAVGSSATIQQLMTAARLLTRRRGGPGGPLRISRSSLRHMVRWLAGSTAAERIRLPGLDPRREDLALPTGIALLAWMDGCGVATLHYAPGSLREGLVIDYLIRRHQRRRPIIDPLAELVTRNGGEGAAVVQRTNVLRRLVRAAHRAPAPRRAVRRVGRR